MAEHPRIAIDPDVLAGKPAIRGTRLAVEVVIGHLADGWTEAEILANYPGVTHEDILACLAYTRDVAMDDQTLRDRKPQMRSGIFGSLLNYLSDFGGEFMIAVVLGWIIELVFAI